MSDTEEQSRPLLNLIGQHVGLGPLNDEVLPLFTKWANDFATNAISGNDLRPASPSGLIAEWEPLVKGERPGWYGFVIYELTTMQPIGMINLRDVDTVHRTAEFGITIGERSNRGKGYGTEAIQLILDLAFNGLNLHNVWLDTLSLNPSAISAYTRAGFREIGRRREAYRLGGRTYDVILMDCLSTDFQRPDVPGWGMAAVTEPIESR